MEAVKKNSIRRGFMKYILIVVYLIFTVSGLILMKLGGNPGSFAVKDGTMTFGMNLISGLGLLCYLCSFIIFTRIITMFANLSYIYPIITGIVQILTLIASALVLKEKITPMGVLGCIIIVAGIVVLNIKK